MPQGPRPRRFQGGMARMREEAAPGRTGSRDTRPWTTHPLVKPCHWGSAGTKRSLQSRSAGCTCRGHTASTLLTHLRRHHGCPQGMRHSWSDRHLRCRNRWRTVRKLPMNWHLRSNKGCMSGSSSTVTNTNTITKQRAHWHTNGT